MMGTLQHYRGCCERSVRRLSSKEHSPFPQLVVIMGLLLMIGSGCSSIRVTDPPRTATEQFLLSGAASRAVGQLSFDALRGRDVFVDTSYFAASEEEFVLGELRARLLLAGVNIVPQRTNAQIVVEVRSGGVGIDRADFLLGLPSFTAAFGENDTFSVPFVLPEVAVLKNIEQWGIASVAYVAYWRDTGEVVASSGPYVGWTTRDDWWVLGYGPQTTGNIPPISTPSRSDLERDAWIDSSSEMAEPQSGNESGGENAQDEPAATGDVEDSE